MNIITNAIDALNDAREQSNSSPDFVPELRIATHLSDDNRAVIQIFDNGLGIPEHISDKLFDPFFTTKPVGQGTGLGLAISHQIITEKHQGRLWHDSTPAQGTTFTIELPIK